MDNAAFKKIVMYCGMMTSDYDNEILTAAKKATKLLRDNKMTWEELLVGEKSPVKWRDSTSNGPRGPSPKSKESAWGGKYNRRSNANPHQKRASWMIDYGNFMLLTKPERSFVIRVQDVINPTQTELLELRRLYFKCGGTN